MIRSIWKSRNLLANLVRRDMTVRYKSTILGFFWSFAKPLAYMGIYQLVFGQILALQIREPRIPYALHILVGVLPWAFFTGATSEAMNSILASANLVKKVKLPLEIFPLAAVCSHAIHFALAMVVVLGAMILFGLPPGPGFLLVPVVAAIQFIFVLAISLLLASLNVFYRDVASIWEVISAAWFYVTPIIYPVYYAIEYFRDHGWRWATWLYLANPMAPITIAYRRLLLYASLLDANREYKSDFHLTVALGIAAIVSAGLLWLSQTIFARLSRRFADQL